jgi:hypothetical protein
LFVSFFPDDISDNIDKCDKEIMKNADVYRLKDVTGKLTLAKIKTMAL